VTAMRRLIQQLVVVLHALLLVMPYVSLVYVIKVGGNDVPNSPRILMTLRMLEYVV